MTLDNIKPGDLILTEYQSFTLLVVSRSVIEPSRFFCIQKWDDERAEETRIRNWMLCRGDGQLRDDCVWIGTSEDEDAK